MVSVISHGTRLSSLPPEQDTNLTKQSEERHVNMLRSPSQDADPLVDCWHHG